jgi:hypothetical protein
MTIADVPDNYVPKRADLVPVFDYDGIPLPGAYVDDTSGALVIIASEFHEAFGFPDTAEGRRETLDLFAEQFRRFGLPIMVRDVDGAVRRLG